MVSPNASRPAARQVAWIFAAVFAVTAFAGFLPNPLVGAEALFVTNAAHNLVHLLTAVGFAIVAALGDHPSRLFMKTFAVVYFLVGVLGFITLGSAQEGHLLGLVHINRMDNFLHVGLSVVIFAAGLFAVDRGRSVAAAQ